MNQTCIITGGSGYVGRHLITHLLEESAYRTIINLDIVEPIVSYPESVNTILCDLRNPVDKNHLKSFLINEETPIYNLAAICRIPGFPIRDYFEVNILGAQHICKLADELGIRTIVFTSSVAPYGASEEVKTEDTIPMPDNPYGSSKMAAEYIHRGWQEKSSDRTLSILRPGIIFGKNEQANFTRLYKSINGGYFFYPGRKDTKKACVYVKDVARACYHFSEKEPGLHLYNLVYPQPPSVQEICEVINQVTGAGKVRWTVPASVLTSAAHVIRAFGKTLGKDFTGIHPDRVKKLMISTNISGVKLGSSDFRLKYNLREAIEDWFNDCEKKELC